MGTVRSRFDLTVVVPCFNEEDNVLPAYDEIVAELGPDLLRLLFVDDGSSDRTLELIRSLAASDARVSYLSFTRNFGIEAAIGAGYRYATGEWLLHLDADMQFPAAEAHKLMAAAEGQDAVFGIRVNRADPWLRRAGSRLNDLIARRLLLVEMPRDATMFRLVRTDVARRAVDLRLGTPYFLATLPRLTGAWTTVPTEHRARVRGSAKVNVRSLTRHAIELFVSHARRTMAISAAACLVAAVLAIASAVVLIAVDEAWHAAALGMLAASVSIGLVALAVMTRYLVHLGRSQARPPLFLVREANVEIDPADRLIAA